VVKEESQYTERTDGVNMDPVSESVIKARRLSFGPRLRTGSIFNSMGLRRGRRASVISGSVAEDGEEGEDDDGDSDDEAPDSPAEETRRRSRSRQAPYRDSVDGTASELGDSRIWANGSSRPATHDEHSIDSRVLDLYNAGIALKKRVISVYVSLCELRSYVLLNKTGFSKALKKYDKILDRNLRRPYMNTTVSPSYPFTDATMQHLDENIARIEQVYAEIVTKGNLSHAKRELRLHLREHVIWERNTVWREMIGIERKAQAANMGIRRTLLGGDHDPSTAQRQGDEEMPAKEIITPLGRFFLPEWLFSLSFMSLVVIVVIFAVLLSVPIMETPEQQNCLAMLVFVSLLWATEVRLLPGRWRGLPLIQVPLGYPTLCDIHAYPFPGRRTSDHAIGR
jgi:phosphate transporter